ncbi:metal-dependent hydrolase [Sulfuriflexus sp.]|uniref:metal-dependent hydrolase n=1 Tax=Sulfuriflexus sp. TaxID=2015443 RepID=UPI0028CEF54A|nr:metal-dependent hydrolase [Sulfuriflexus sp.]MDT8404924.1 metal-dependent hydrolase [Sulfuriflexus sp.]
MDLITQGFLGAALAQTVARPAETRLATGIGFAAGLLADADALIYSSADSLLTIEYHRHFTHSIFFIPFGTLIAALLLWPFCRHKLGFKRLYVFSLLGYSLSGFIDACTSYGTYLLWPLFDERFAFHIISIVDPIFTLALIIGVAVAWRRRSRLPARLGLAVAALYLGVAVLQLQRAESAIESLAATRGHVPARLIAKPSFGNILLWRSVYEHAGYFYIDAVRVGRQPRLFEGSAIKQYRPARDSNGLARDSVLYRDIMRFQKFSDNYIALHPQYANVLADVRYSIEPDGVLPLWGIEMDFGQPQQHARFRVYRNLTRQQRERFLAMLMNADELPNEPVTVIE